MRRRDFLGAAAISTCSAGAFAQAPAAQSKPGVARKPNIVFVYIDDMGYGDLSCYGNTDIETPQIDRMAREGIRFEQFYVAAPVCSPSRVGITTGQFPARHLINTYLSGRKRNRSFGMRDFLDPEVPAIARTFKQAGYATAHFGKWHQGGGRDVDDAPHPKAYGFDESLVSFEGLGDRILPPGGLSDQSEALGQGEIRRVPKYEMTGIYVDRAVDFISRNKAKPFYLHVWLNDVHDGYSPKPELVEKYARFSENKFVQAYYAVMDEMDRQLGRLFHHIDQLGLGEDTIVVVSSDNGPTAWPSYYKQEFEPPGKTAGLRGRKWSLYEGGIREPLIVRWKGHVPAGVTNRDTVLCAVDFFPTFCALAGVPSPAVEFDGEDMRQAFLGRSQRRRKKIFWDYGRDETYERPAYPYDQSPNLAVRDGDWKLLVNDDGSRIELYNIRQTPMETTNVAEKHPDVVKRLSTEVLEWRRKLPVLGGS